MLELLVVPACFVAAGLLGWRLGTPTRVSGGLVAVGACHLLAFLGSRQALHDHGWSTAWVHLASQVLFLGGFAAVVWLAAAYPDARPAPTLVAVAGGLAVLGPVLAAVSGPTAAIIDSGRQLGPVAHLAPRPIASLSVAPLLVLPLLAAVVFVVRYRRAARERRPAMRWPVVGTAGLFLAVLAGSLADGPLVTAAFLLTAPLLPLALAFGPVVDRIGALDAALAESRQLLVDATRPRPRPGSLDHLTPREHDVLQAMARGAANPVIARELHLSLSSVEKHATSIFRKLEVAEGPEVHRRVAAVVAYRDALEDDAL